VPAGALLAAGAILVWALALYVASRSLARRVSQLAAAAMLCLAAYLMAEGLGGLAPDLSAWSTWLRRTWWAPSLALPLWLSLSLALMLEESPSSALVWLRSWFKAVATILVSIGAILAVIGTLTTAIQNWESPFVDPLSAPATSRRRRFYQPFRFSRWCASSGPA
jgi:hypothetical protein